jgi:hypothetical protein
MDRHYALVEKYEHLRREAAEHQVVDMAEDILGRVWVDYLTAMHARSVDVATVAREAVGEARRLLRAARIEGDAQQIDCAAELLLRAERDLVRALAEARRAQGDVERGLQRVGDATLDRTDRQRSDASRLRAAHAAAYGAGGGA